MQTSTIILMLVGIIAVLTAVVIVLLWLMHRKDEDLRAKNDVIIHEVRRNQTLIDKAVGHGVSRAALFSLAIMLIMGQSAWAQDGSAQFSFGESAQMSLADKLATISLDSCEITDIGVMVCDMEMYVKTDSLTQKTDTTLVINKPVIVWQSEGYDMDDLQATSRQRAARRAPTSNPTFQYGNLMEYFQDFYYYVFSFNYTSVDADGKSVTLSAMAACPPIGQASQINNVIIGTHITITADKERPSSHFSNFSQDDWGMLFSLAAGPKMVFTEEYTAILGAASVSWGAGLLAAGVCLVVPFVGGIAAGIIAAGSLAASIGSIVFLADQNDKINGYQGYNNNLVIMPDYEGYGVTSNRAHPYLYQELTARQCVDATLYGMKIYQSHDKLKNIRLSFRDDFRTMSCGYSQGGSVAMAVHRFIEQNNMDQTLHFSGSCCGDGPYDPISTLMFYVSQEKNGDYLSMPVVLPLIVKGMLDTNPYMVNHKAEDYFNPKFLETGIMQWLNDKQMTISDIDRQFEQLYNNGKDGDPNYYRDIIVKSTTKVRSGDNVRERTAYKARLSGVMNAECYAYFSKLFDRYKYVYTSAAGIPLPSQRGVIEDLHFALASNDMTSGWTPRHTVMLFHSEGDTVVPYVNALKAKNTLGNMVSLETAPNQLDHGDSGVDFFKGDSNIADIVLNRTINLRLYDNVSTITDNPY